jgi:predicted GIY-YIG superfamily endonuclease
VNGNSRITRDASRIIRLKSSEEIERVTMAGTGTGKGDYLCYTITHGYTATYVGITNHFENRLKQHNGVIKGGAKATRRYDDWKLAFYVTGFTTKNEVLSFEWHMHHPEGRRRWKRSADYKGFLGRVRALCDILVMEKFAEIAPKLKCHITRETKEILVKSIDGDGDGDENQSYYDILSTFIEILDL